jgi:nanoRNase/pAp phosphatase (c-di-AMP/oligoRNAs hydrolase)
MESIYLLHVSKYRIKITTSVMNTDKITVPANGSLNGEDDTGIKKTPVPSYRANARASMYEKLSALLEERKEKNHLILIHGAPDPDAISSALAFSCIGDLFEITSTILTFAPVSHHENRALVKKLGITLQRYTADFDISMFDFYSIIDCQKAYTPIDGRLEESDVEFLAFIDHHREDSVTPHAAFVDVRPHYGSTATIFCEYLQSAFPEGLSPSDSEHVRICTALMHGLRSDTQKFILATQEEFAAAAFIAPCVESQVIEVIERKVLSPAVLEMFENALVNRKVHDNFIISDVGYVREADRDGLPQIADILLAREGTDTALVFGIIDKSVIDGSLRTRSETINPDEFLKGVLGVSPESGKHYGGGNIRDRGAFQIPLGFFSMHEDQNQIYAMAREIVEKSFLEYIGKTSSGKSKNGSKHN